MSNITPYTKSLQVSGPDASKFLQGQLTCDVTQAPTFGAYCNIKGKVECFFKLEQHDGKFLLSMPDSMLDSTLQELKKYAAFSKVELQIVEHALVRDPVQEIQDMIPEIYPETKAMFFAHDLNLPQINAVSFTKGCYRGQEIVARMQHRGKLKRGLHQFTSENQDLCPGSEVALNATSGTVVRLVRNANQVHGLAVGTTSTAE